MPARLSGDWWRHLPDWDDDEQEAAEEAGYCLVWALGSAPTRHELGRIHLARWERSGGWMDGPVCLKRVTHWLPLPERPRDPG